MNTFSFLPQWISQTPSTESFTERIACLVFNCVTHVPSEMASITNHLLSRDYIVPEIERGRISWLLVGVSLRVWTTQYIMKMQRTLYATLLPKYAPSAWEVMGVRSPSARHEGRTGDSQIRHAGCVSSSATLCCITSKYTQPQLPLSYTGSKQQTPPQQVVVAHYCLLENANAWASTS